jgi:hypothetical protein
MGLNICENLYAEGNATTPPYWAYDHELDVVPGEDCRKNSSGSPINTSLSGIEFYPQAGGSFPAAYHGALFFSDRWRDCIWAMLPGPDGLPQSGNVVKFAQLAESPINLEVGPGGDLYYVDSETETVKRFRFTPSGDAYVRPKAASPMRLSLVPAYRECIAPNRTHGAPLAHRSCNPPAQTSSRLTVGTPDANGAPANSVGFMEYAVRPGSPGTPADDADVSLRLEITDVRNAADLSDYAGELQARVNVRVTDSFTGGSGSGPATVQDVLLRANVPCTSTLAGTIGGSCQLATTLDALNPGLVQEGARAVWQLGQVDLLDGDDAVFARQGIFVP